MMEKEKDEVLIQKLKKGDESAFNELYHRYVKLVYYIAYKTCKNDADSKDVVQETFLEVKRAIGSLQNPSVFKFWLNRITLSKCKNLFRKNKFEFVQENSGDVQANISEDRQYLLPEKAMHRTSDQEVLSALIQQLPYPQQQVLILFYLEQFSIEEVAQIMDIPIGTVKSRLSYARTSLKGAIEKYEHTYDTQLSFHSLSSGIALCLGSELAGMELSSSLLNLMGISVIKPSFFKKASHLFMGETAKIVFASTLLLTTGGILYSAQKSKDTHQNVNNVMNNSIQEGEETIVFPKVHALGKDINTAQSAYFTIKSWACCEEEMKQLSKLQLDEIYRVLNTLEAIESPYYESLCTEGWTSDFTKIYENLK